MGFHTYDVERAEALEDQSRFAYLSVDELLALLDSDPGATVADLGSGTGFYTDEVAPYTETLYAVDVQREMHDLYRDKGLPENVVPVTAEVVDLPFADGGLDGAFSTMTYHEFATEDALTELARVLAPGASLAVGDWTATGAGERGPPPSERFDASEASDQLSAAGFEVRRTEDRRETFVVAAERP